MPKKAKSKKKKAFTLVEILAVMLVIALLFVFLVPKINSITDKAKETQVKTKFREFGTAAELALKEHSGFTGMAKSKVPMNTDNKILNTLNEYMDDRNKFEYFNNSMSYSESKAKDPWGNPYSLIIEADINKNTGKFTFVSYGKDGKKSRDFRRGKTEDMRDAYDYAYVIEYKDGIITRTFMGLDDILEAHGVSGSGSSGGSGGSGGSGDGGGSSTETVTLTYNGNENTGGSAPAAQQIKKGDTATLSGSNGMSRTKATFIGWSLTKVAIVDSEEAKVMAAIKKYVTMNNDETVYAVWAIDENENGTPDYEEKTSEINITFDGNGHDSGDPPKAMNLAEGKTLNLEPHLYPQEVGGMMLVELDMYKTNATHMGWSKTKNTVITTQEAEDAAGIIPTISTETANGNITLYAVWAQDENQNYIPDYKE